MKIVFVLLVKFCGGGVQLKADLIVTDPPYLINYQTDRRSDKSHEFCKPIENDTNPQLIIDIIPLLYDILKDNSAMYMFCSPDRIDFFKQEVEKYFTIKNIIVWDKGNWTAGDLQAQYGKGYEFIIYANKGRAKFNNECKRYNDIWQFNRVVGKDQIHQNQKPLDLLYRIIKQHTKQGDLILDPFSGSGSSLIASYNLQRNYLGFEIDTKEYEKSIKWINSVKKQINMFDIIGD